MRGWAEAGVVVIVVDARCADPNRQEHGRDADQQRELGMVETLAADATVGARRAEARCADEP